MRGEEQLLFRYMRYILFVGAGDGNELSEGGLGVAIVTGVRVKFEWGRLTVTGVAGVRQSLSGRGSLLQV